jgi:hypothetical protein
MPRPALGKVAVGDRLLVIPATYNNRMKQEPVEAVVTKVARVWVEMERSDGNGFRPTTWRLRLDTQHDGADSNYRTRFLTPEQHAWEEQTRMARVTLFDAGITLNGATPWRDEERLLALADFVRAYDVQHP